MMLKTNKTHMRKFSMKTRRTGIHCLIFLFFCLMGVTSFAQERITGTVKSVDGEALIGANIVQKGTGNGAATDINGNYSLTLGEGQKVLIFSYTGFQEVEEVVGNRTVIDVLLKEGELLDEVVVVGYGKQKKSDLTGAVASISAKDIAKVPVARVDQALQGRAAGVQVTQTSGSPGAPTAIRVRGGNSITGSNEPLWVIDGIVVGTNFNLNNINANDIQSLEVLKDASSIAIYGSRGANGVVLLTTKSGGGLNPGTPQVSLNL